MGIEPWQRWWANVERALDPGVPGLGPCLLWTGRTSADGYPLFDVGGRTVRAHRWAWEQHNGLVLPADWTLDHLCHTYDHVCPGGDACWHRACVRFTNHLVLPSGLALPGAGHLEPLPPGENVARRHARDRAIEALSRGDAPPPIPTDLPYAFPTE